MDYFFILILGLIWGSFANVCIWRIPRGENIIFPPSHCPKCKSKIKFYDNIPVLSFLFLKGRCRKCGEKISIRYPIVEILTALFALLSYLKGGFTFFSIYLFLISFLFLILLFIDLEFTILPDTITIGGTFFFFFYSLIFKIQPSPYERVLASALGSFLFLFVLLLFYLLKGYYGMGYGDVKLMAFVGVIFGFPNFLYTIIGGSLFALLFYLFYYIFSGEKKPFLPFGTFLSIFSLFYLFYL